MTSPMNLFDDDQAAARYEAARPSVHAGVIRRVASLLGSVRLRRALDVACGTGQSTRALTPIASSVVGLDSSRSMLRHRRRDAPVLFARGVAERLPFQTGVFDLVSVGLALHWFHHAEFLAETSRVLRSEGWLLVYDSGFCARMERNEDFPVWVEQFRGRFPHAPRNEVQPAGPDLAACGLTHVTTEPVLHTESYDVDRFCLYLLTQSNVLAAIREQRDSTNSAESWLRQSLSYAWPGGSRLFEFSGWLTLYRRLGTTPALDALGDTTLWTAE